jgi:predicted anti-sigma-YlaC factor YlaD
MLRHWGRPVAACLCAGSLAACSINRLAVNKIGDALAGSGTTFSADDDPELVRDAVPFSLKLIESLLNTSPRHRGLLFAASSGFTQYAFAFVQQEADTIEPYNLAYAQELRRRARNLYLRGRDYGVRGLEVRFAGIGQRLRQDPAAAVRPATREDVPLLYWTAASWGAAISLSKDDPEMIADLPIVEALIDRALELDEAFEAGAIHSFLIAYETSRQGAAGDPYARVRTHFDRAVQLTGGNLAGPFVSYAEGVSVPRQNRAEFDSLLRRAVAIDVNARPEWRLANLVLQRRARWLLRRADELFLDVR